VSIVKQNRLKINWNILIENRIESDLIKFFNQF